MYSMYIYIPRYGRAYIIKNDRTVSTTFKLPLYLDKTSTCNIKPNTTEGCSLAKTKILILNEITMASKIVFNAVNTFMKDLLDSDRPFGNLISGKFCQS